MTAADDAHVAAACANHAWQLHVSIERAENMPKGIPVGTMSMGSHGAVNAALFAAAILATGDKEMEKKLIAFREAQTAAISQDVPDN